MKEFGKCLFRIILKSTIIAVIFIILVTLFDYVRDEIRYNNMMKETQWDTISPVTRDYQSAPQQDSIWREAEIKRLENR